MKRDPMETAAALLASSPIFQGAIPQELQAFLLRGGVPPPCLSARGNALPTRGSQRLPRYAR